jgi:multidrug resistance protein MdtO
MGCYLLYTGVDWYGIHTAFITCVFIALGSTEATLRKGTLRIVGCLIGALLALFTIFFLIPHMETIASLVIVVACVSAIAGWVATGTERIAYAGLQMAFAFYYSLFPGFDGYAPDTDLTHLRDRVVGILLGLTVTALVFHYIWPEKENGDSELKRRGRSQTLQLCGRFIAKASARSDCLNSSPRSAPQVLIQGKRDDGYKGNQQVGPETPRIGGCLDHRNQAIEFCAIRFA